MLSIADLLGVPASTTRSAVETPDYYEAATLETPVVTPATGRHGAVRRKERASPVTDWPDPYLRTILTLTTSAKTTTIRGRSL